MSWNQLTWLSSHSGSAPWQLCELGQVTSPPHSFEFLIYKIEENTGTDFISWLWDWHQCTRGVPTLSGAVNASPPFAPDLACSTSLQTALLSTRLPCPFSSRPAREVCLLQAEFRSGGWACPGKWAPMVLPLVWQERAGSCEAVCPALRSQTHTHLKEGEII